MVHFFYFSLSCGGGKEKKGGFKKNREGFISKKKMAPKRTHANVTSKQQDGGEDDKETRAKSYNESEVAALFVQLNEKIKLRNVEDEAAKKEAEGMWLSLSPSLDDVHRLCKGLGVSEVEAKRLLVVAKGDVKAATHVFLDKSMF